MDGVRRRIEPGIEPVAPRVASTYGRLRAYGNAIVAPLAAEFIAAVMDCQP
jgi:DNA (cytosine-5)-methyltransferase 1